MKQIDMSQSVMERIASFERHRTHRWIRVFYIWMISIVISIGLFIIHAMQVLSDQHSWDLFLVFAQDREIISEFWQDTIVTFIHEVPQDAIFWVGVIVVGLFSLLIATRKRRTLNARRLSQLAKRERKEQK